MAPRLIKSLELGNRNFPKRYKEAMFAPPKNAIEREERLATVWMAFVQDAGFAINSYWSQSMDLDELKCALPTSAQEFKKKVCRRSSTVAPSDDKDPTWMEPSTQDAHSADVLTK